jgi:hypothetical protein
METSKIEPRTTDRIRVRYSGASPVPPDHRAAARIAKNELEIQREAVHHVPAAEELALEPGGEQARGAPEHSEGTEGGERRHEAHALLEKDPDKEDQDREPERYQLGEECQKGLSGKRH